MKALSKLHKEVGIWMTDVPAPELGHNDLLIRDPQNRHLRHRYPYLQLGRVVPEDHSGTHGGRP